MQSARVSRTAQPGPDGFCYRSRNYLGLFRNWPPAAHDAAGVPVDREDCIATMVLAFTQLNVQPRHIRILTEFQGVLSMREIVVSEEIFAQVFAAFSTTLGARRLVRSENSMSHS